MGVIGLLHVHVYHSYDQPASMSTGRDVHILLGDLVMFASIGHMWFVCREGTVVYNIREYIRGYYLVLRSPCKLDNVSYVRARLLSSVLHTSVCCILLVYDLSYVKYVDKYFLLYAQ